MITDDTVINMYKEFNAGMDLLDLMRYSGDYKILELLESTSRVIVRTLEVANKDINDTKIHEDIIA